MTGAKVIEANVAFYLQIAEKYDHYETYLFDPVLQLSLEDDLDKIGSYFVSLGRTPSCLECGGGTGNLTLKMCARGWAVTVVDVSEKMLGLLQEKARAQGHSPTLLHGPIERFLRTTSGPYDLVAFSSVLHHLYSYLSVVESAAKLLRPGGIFYSNYDPLAPKSPFWARAFDSFDTAIAKVLFDPKASSVACANSPRGAILSSVARSLAPAIWRNSMRERVLTTGKFCKSCKQMASLS